MQGDRDVSPYFTSQKSAKNGRGNGTKVGGKEAEKCCRNGSVTGYHVSNTRPKVRRLTARLSIKMGKL